MIVNGSTRRASDLASSFMSAGKYYEAKQFEAKNVDWRGSSSSATPVSNKAKINTNLNITRNRKTNAKIIQKFNSLQAVFTWYEISGGFFSKYNTRIRTRAPCKNALICQPPILQVVPSKKIMSVISLPATVTITKH